MGFILSRDIWERRRRVQSSPNNYNEYESGTGGGAISMVVLKGLNGFKEEGGQLYNNNNGNVNGY